MTCLIGSGLACRAKQNLTNGLVGKGPGGLLGSPKYPHGFVVHSGMVGELSLWLVFVEVGQGREIALEIDQFARGLLRPLIIGHRSQSDKCDLSDVLGRIRVIPHGFSFQLM